MAALPGRHLRPFMDLRQPGQTTGRCTGVSALNGHKVDRRVFPSSVDLEIEFESIEEDVHGWMSIIAFSAGHGCTVPDVEGMKSVSWVALSFR